ncbi:Wzz/FepE/Etk N-terminal domain-containing protein [uncultured Clostridium sp.]|uniref:YveK family protein n=1 Tax=uncultured Clostridium sp. TaxID=59620 RepID=UPI0025DDE1D8|nr:Wzz/FepE/Etk N-terminal domain-containing protein [uncultured Clostridium sp.]
MGDREIRLDDIIHALKKRVKLIALITLVITFATIIAAFFIIEPKYKVNTTLFVGKEEGSIGDNKTKDYSSNDIQMYQKTLDTFATIIGTNTFVKDSLKESKIDVPVNNVIKNLEVSAKSNTQILSISYKDTDPVMTSRILASIANRFEVYATELIPNVNVKIIEEVVVPEKPVSPNKKLYIALALILGVLGGSVIAISIDFLDSTFENKSELEEALGVVVLGDIPNLESN